MRKRQAKETLKQAKTRLTREHTNRTAPKQDRRKQDSREKEVREDLENEWPEHSSIDKKDTQGKRRSVEARKSGLCERLLWVVCVVVLFCGCVVFCSVLLVLSASLSELTIVLQK